MHLVKRLLIALALVVSAVVLIPAPAQAGGGYMRVCFPVETRWGTFWDCHWIEVPVFGPRDPWPPECLTCGLDVDFWKDDRVNPEILERFHVDLGKGLAVLAESHLVEDEKLRERLRAESFALFTSAAKAVEKYPVELHETAWVDIESGKVFESKDPLLHSVGRELAAGIASIQANLWDPQPDPPAALKHFDAAYGDIAALAAG